MIKRPSLLPGLGLSLGLLLSCSTKDADSSPEASSDSSPSADSSASSDSSPIDGLYELSEVTCAGEPVEVSVTATVSFDGGAYLEEWSFVGAQCTMSLEGQVVLTEDELSLTDVELSCSAECEAEGIPCHDEPCPADQVYQYSLDGDALLLSFTQQGDEFSCGPCGDGVESSYLLTRTSAP